MRWADIDMEGATWILSAAETKSDRTHLVPLSPAAMAILKAVPRLGAHVFSTDGETFFQGYAKTKATLDQYVAAAGGPLHPWTLHDLRRSAATHMVRLGISETVVARILNHARQGVTAKVYALHSYAPEKRHALEAWAAEIARVVEGKQADNVVALHG